MRNNRTPFGLLNSVVFLILIGCVNMTFASENTAMSAKDKLGWELGVQCWTFRLFSFEEAVEKAALLDLDYVEIYPGQKLSPEGEEKVHHTASAETRAKIKQTAKDAGIPIRLYGVVIGQSEEEWRQIFEFAKELDLKGITSEPKPEDMELVDQLSDEFGIVVAIHNHPKPSAYWKPENVLQAVEGHGDNIGFCADTGHWTRAGLDPVECLKMADNKLISFHIKDINVPERDAHDVPWGSGVSKMYGLLAEANRQDFEGYLSIEYEHNWENSIPDIRKCIDYFDAVTESFVEEGFKPLLKDDLSNALYEEEGWKYEDGVLEATGNGDIWTKERYGDFILELEFKTTPETNSGVFLRCGSIEDWLHSAIEVQILQPEESNARHNCGAIFDVKAPSEQMIKEPGEWNKYVIIAKDNMIHVMLNGRQVNYVDLDGWTEAGKNPDGSPNKFRDAYADMPREGHIGLQYHGNPIWYRNLRIKEL